MTKIPIIDAERAEPFANFFKTMVGFTRTLREQFPVLYGSFITLAERQRQNFIEAQIQVLRLVTPGSSERIDARSDGPLRKKLRDRFATGLTTMLAAYDRHVPRPGGRIADHLENHRLAGEKLRGASWTDLSTKNGSEHAEEDRARKAARDRDALLAACLTLIGECGPESGASIAVKDEFERLRGGTLAPVFQGMKLKAMQELILTHEFMHWMGIVGQDTANQTWTLPNGSRVQGSLAISEEVKKQCF